MMLSDFNSLKLIDVSGRFNMDAARGWHQNLQKFWQELGNALSDKRQGGNTKSDDRHEIVRKLLTIFNRRNDTNNGEALAALLRSEKGWQEWPIERLQQLLTYSRMLSNDADMDQLFTRADDELKRLEAIYQFSKEIVEQDAQAASKAQKQFLEDFIVKNRQLIEKYLALRDGKSLSISWLGYCYYDKDSDCLKLHIDPAKLTEQDLSSKEVVEDLRALPAANRTRISIDNYDELSAQQAIAFSLITFRAGHDLIDGDLYKCGIRQENSVHNNLSSIFENRSILAGTVDWVQPTVLSKLVDTVLSGICEYSDKVASLREIKNERKQKELRSYGLDLGSLCMMFSEEMANQLQNREQEDKGLGRKRMMELLLLYQQTRNRNSLLNKVAEYLGLSLAVPVQKAMAEQWLNRFEAERKSNIEQYTSSNSHFADISVNSNVPLLSNAYRLRDMAKFDLLSPQRQAHWLQRLANYYDEEQLQQFKNDYASYKEHLESGAKLWQQLELKPDMDSIALVQKLSEKLERYALAPDLFETSAQQNLLAEVAQLGLPTSSTIPMHAQLMDAAVSVKQLLIYANEEVQLKDSQSMRDSFSEFYRVSMREQSGELGLQELVGRVQAANAPEESGLAYREIVDKLRGICYAAQHTAAIANELALPDYLQQLFADEGYSKPLIDSLMDIAQNEHLISAEPSVALNTLNLAGMLGI